MKRFGLMATLMATLLSVAMVTTTALADVVTTGSSTNNVGVSTQATLIGGSPSPSSNSNSVSKSVAANVLDQSSHHNSVRSYGAIPHMLQPSATPGSYVTRTGEQDRTNLRSWSNILMSMPRYLDAEMIAVFKRGYLTSGREQALHKLYSSVTITANIFRGVKKGVKRVYILDPGILKGMVKGVDYKVAGDIQFDAGDISIKRQSLFPIMGEYCLDNGIPLLVFTADVQLIQGVLKEIDSRAGSFGLSFGFTVNQGVPSVSGIGFGGGTVTERNWEDVLAGVAAAGIIPVSDRFWARVRGQQATAVGVPVARSLELEKARNALAHCPNPTVGNAKLRLASMRIELKQRLYSSVIKDAGVALRDLQGKKGSEAAKVRYDVKFLAGEASYVSSGVFLKKGRCVEARDAGMDALRWLRGLKGKGAAKLRQQAHLVTADALECLAGKTADAASKAAKSLKEKKKLQKASRKFVQLASNHRRAARAGK